MKTNIKIVEEFANDVLYNKQWDPASVYDHELHDDAADDEEEFYETDDGYDVLPKERYFVVIL